MKNKTICICTAVFLFLISGINDHSVFSQNKTAPPPFEVLYSNSNGNINQPVLTNTMPPVKEKNPQLIRLETQLEAARTSGNTVTAKQVQKQIDALLGSEPVESHMEPGATIITGLNIPLEQPDYQQAQIHNLSIMSAAIATVPAGAPTAGKLWYVTTRYNGSGADTLKFYTSTNNGASWVYYGGSFLPSNYDYNRDELDLELVYDGTDVWLFCVAGLRDISSDNRRCEFIRFNTTTNVGSWVSILSFPGGSSATEHYNPRITSDNANYTSNAYVMILCSLDSTAGSNHFVKQKYVLITSPFAGSLSFNYNQPSGSDGFYWYANNLTNANTYLYGDIAYYKDDGGTGQGRVVAVYGNYGTAYNNIYISYLNGYNSFGGSLSITEPNINKQVKIAFNGGANNRNGMISYVRQYNSADWDIFALRTTTGGSTAGSWTRDTIDYSGDRARTCDLIAVRNANNQFKLCYSQDNPSVPAGFYKYFNGSTWSAKIQFSSLTVDTAFAKPRAGYMLGGGDDGLAVWSSAGGYNGYLAKDMQSTTGITGNSQIPSGYSLSQNYPNPFNPSTTIRFALPVSGYVSIKIYDIAGKLVSEIVNSNLEAGLHEISYNASNLSSGAYFYRIEANGFTDVKKMLLIK